MLNSNFNSFFLSTWLYTPCGDIARALSPLWSHQTQVYHLSGAQSCVESFAQYNTQAHSVDSSLDIIQSDPKNALSESPFCETGFDGMWPSTVGCFTCSGRPHTLKPGFAITQFRQFVFLGRPAETLLGIRPKLAYSRQGLDWIVGPGYSFGVFSTSRSRSFEISWRDWKGGPQLT